MPTSSTRTSSAGILALLLALVAPACGGGRAPRVERVVIVSVDTLRADQLGCYGNTTYPTPAADRLAEGALVFDRAYSQATMTHPALTSMLTGLYPHRHGVLDQTNGMRNEAESLPGMLREHGVATGSFVANLCKLQDHASTVFAQGWDVTGCGMDDAREQWEWDVAVVDEALAWLERQDGPTLCWIHLMDPHAEHRPPPDLWDYARDPPDEKFDQYDRFVAFEEARTLLPDPDREHLWGLYGAEVQGADRQLGRVLDAIDASPQADRTAVIFTADHGEELFETWHRYDHGLSLTEGVLWIPLLVRAPGVDPGAYTAPVELLQVTPTVLELFDAAPPYGLDGVSLLDPVPTRGYAVSAESDITTTIRDERHRVWLRHSDRPWRRPERLAPWRGEAPWFEEKFSVADYDRAVRTRVRWLDAAGPAGRPVVLDAIETLVRLNEQLGERPVAQVIEDEELDEQLNDLGYNE